METSNMFISVWSADSVDYVPAIIAFEYPDTINDRVCRDAEVYINKDIHAICRYEWKGSDLLQYHIYYSAGGDKIRNVAFGTEVDRDKPEMFTYHRIEEEELAEMYSDVIAKYFSVFIDHKLLKK